MHVAIYERMLHYFCQEVMFSPCFHKNIACAVFECLLYFNVLNLLLFQYRNNQWSFCPSGYFLNGLYRTSGHKLHNIEEGRCCRPSNHPDRYGSCYNEDVAVSFNTEGWSSCSKAGYYITGVYRGSGKDELDNIDKFRCCQMAIGKGE